MVDTAYLSSHAVCRHTGATYRQLDWWCRHGILPEHSNGRGKRRRFSEHDLIVTKVMFHLASLGCQVETLQKVSQALYAQDLTEGDIVVSKNGNIRFISCAPIEPGWIVPIRG